MISSTWRYQSDAYRWLLATISAKGDLMRSEDGALCREVCNLGVAIQEPLAGWPIAGSGWDLPALDRYAEQLLDWKNPSGFEYTYGERLTTYPDSLEDRCYQARFGEPGDITNQIGRVVDRLRQNPTSRRAIAITWIPGWDSYKADVPCLQIVDFLIRQGRLSLTAYFRSWDCQRAAPANMYGLGKLQSHVADAVGVPTGSLTIIAASAHTYED